MARVAGFALILAPAADDWTTGGPSFHHGRRPVRRGKWHWRRTGSFVSGTDATGRHRFAHLRSIRFSGHFSLPLRGHPGNRRRKAERRNQDPAATAWESDDQNFGQGPGSVGRVV